MAGKGVEDVKVVVGNLNCYNRFNLVVTDLVLVQSRVPRKFEHLGIIQ
jgi:hypothetical protein